MAAEETPPPSLGDLPADVAACVLSRAGARTAARAAATCRAWRSVAVYGPLWRDLLARDLSPSCQCPPWSADDAADSWQRLYGRWASAAPRATQLRVHSGPDAARRRVAALSFGDAAALFSAGDDGALLAWDAETGTVTSRASAAHGGAPLACVSASSSAVVTGGADNALRLWDPRLGLDAPPVLVLPGAHAGEIFSVLLLPDGRLASGGGDEMVRLWDTRAGSDAPPLLEMEGGGGGSVFALAHDARCSRLYAAIGREVCLFDLDDDGTWLSTLRGHGGDVAALSLGETSLLSGGDDGRVCSWLLPPPGAAVEEEPEADVTLEVALGAEGGEVVRASVTSLVGLGEAPAAFLAATWQGGLVMGELETQRVRPFGGNGGVLGGGEAVTAMAGRARVVAVGTDAGGLHFVRMDEAREE